MGPPIVSDAVGPALVLAAESGREPSVDEDLRSWGDETVEPGGFEGAVVGSSGVASDKRDLTVSRRVELCSVSAPAASCSVRRRSGPRIRPTPRERRCEERRSPGRSASTRPTGARTGSRPL